MQSFQNYNPSDQEFKSFVCELLSRIYDNQIDLEQFENFEVGEYSPNPLHRELLNIRRSHLKMNSELIEYLEAYLDILKTFSNDNALLQAGMVQLFEEMSKLCQKIDSLKGSTGDWQ